jgi:hypothetical protein
MSTGPGWATVPATQIGGAQMTVFSMCSLPFAVPQKIDPGLETVRRYWAALRREQNALPFADDLNVEQLSQFAPRLLVLDVCERPQRFRITIVGKEIEAAFHEELADRFVDEIAEHSPLEYLDSQCCALMQSQTPAWFERRDAKFSYERLLLPMWGNGYVSMILGAYAWCTPA